MNLPRLDLARARPWLRRGAFCAVLAVAALVIAISLCPLPEALEHPTPATLSLLDRRGALLAEIPSPAARSQHPVALAEMGPWLPKITVALEDHRFLQHRGVDWRGTLGSAWRNLRHGRIVGGGSTITQQVIKLAEGRQGRAWRAKIHEALAAWQLERRWSKERILAEYLNRSDYGNRLIGPEAAARWYFAKPARDLTLGEAVFLAGLPHAPTRYNPWQHRARAEAHYRHALRTLTARGVLAPEQAERLASAPITAGRFLPPTGAPHFVQMVRQAQPTLTGPVRTTLDLTMQERAEELVRTHLRLLHRTDVTCAAVVVLQNSTAAVRAMVGSPDFAAAQVNEATATHSCGSTLKPFLYLRGLDTRLLTAATVLPDTAEAIRDAYADYDPQDYTRRYLGPVRVREALACSLNVPAVVALSRIGARAVFYDLGRWGFHLPRSLDDYGAGFILGNAEVRPLDLAAAYAGLARGGVSIAPTFLEGVKHRGERIASAEATAILTDLLCDNDARRRGFGTHSPLALARRTAAKTGTSSGFRDAWTVGFTRDHTIAVWVGNASARPMREALSIRAAAPLWAALMEDLLRDDPPVESPAASERLVSVPVSRQTGLLPSDPHDATLPEWFLAGTEPRLTDAAQYTIDEQGRRRLLLPAEYAAWCDTSYNTLAAFCPSATRLSITSPVNHAKFAVDEALPRAQQKLELACTGSLGRVVHWFANDQELTASAQGRMYWNLAEGEWHLRAQTGDETAEVQITVER